MRFSDLEKDLDTLSRLNIISQVHKTFYYDKFGINKISTYGIVYRRTQNVTTVLIRENNIISEAISELIDTVKKNVNADGIKLGAFAPEINKDLEMIMLRMEELILKEI